METTLGGAPPPRPVLQEGAFVPLAPVLGEIDVFSIRYQAAVPG